jgi:hypothetical protein
MAGHYGIGHKEIWYENVDLIRLAPDKDHCSLL